MPLTKVTSGVIAANAVVDSFGTQSITGDKIGLNAITGNTLASNIINANNIVNATITGAKLAATTITGDKITVGTITGNLIAANTITGDDLGQNSVSANNIATNAIENYTSLTGRPLSNRNLIINGAMQVAQRATSNTGITANGYYTADRWLISLTTTGTWTMNVESSAPTGTEFRNSANVICTTADSSLAAGDRFDLQQRIEGFNCQQIKKGTANAESITVSFWAKSSNTGTYICELFDNVAGRQISKSYTIVTANTWEKKTVTFPPDTTGQFNNDNGANLILILWLAAGTTYTSGTLNSSAWASSVNANRVVGQLNLANRIGNYFAYTGVQMELGTVATPFEMRNHGAELALCERYFEIMQQASIIGCADGSNVILCPYTYRTIKRETPSLTLLTTTVTVTEPTVASRTSSGATLGAGTGASTQSCIHQIFGFSSLTNQNVVMGGNAANVPVLAISAEL